MTSADDDDVPRSSAGPPTTVFVSDPSADAERVAQALRTGGYIVVDVPLSMLVARVAVQRPRVILVDADSTGALDAVARMRELPDADGIDVLFFARAGGALSTSEQALSNEGSGLFARPIEVESVLKKIDALTGGSKAPPPVPPPRRMSSRPPPPSSVGAPSSPVSGASLPPASMRVAEPISSRPPSPRVSVAAPLPSLRPSMPIDPGASGSEASRRPPTAPLSAELEQLLAEAEQRVPLQVSPESIPPTPEEEIEAVLPAELLESLDEPLDEDDDDDAQESAYSPMHRATGVGSAKGTTGAGTGVGSSVPGTGPGVGTGAGKVSKTTGAHRALGTDSSLTPAPVKTHGGTHSGTTGSVSTTGERREGASRVESMAQSPPSPVRVDDAPALSPREGSQPPPTAYSGPPPVAALDDALPVDSLGSRARAPEVAPPAPAIASTVLGPGDAPRFIARAIAARTTGSLAFDSGGTIRRVLLREGDVVTVASGSDEESLLAFLGVRGELPRETVRRLAGKFPGFGRHGGAALVAHGYLRQDQLWPVLRAHAEWILGRMLLLTSGTAAHESDPPGRLRAEPGVFGGSTGAEVFVEVLRRVVAPPEAVERVGGAASRIGDGENASLLSECALTAREAELLGEARGKTVQQLLDAAGESDMATVLYAASLLGVVEVLRSVGPPTRDAEDVGPDVDALDEEAIRARVRARVQLVDDGDYFAVLGVAHNATGYEVKRAFLELRRAFEPSRILTPQVADLADDVRKVVSVLEEAYEILRDGARRERYRRAIDAVPV